MKTFADRPPVVLALSAHDPSGAAGVQADIESIRANGAACVSVLTALTAQNTGRFDSLQPQLPAIFRTQAELLLEDIHIDAIKIGLIGSTDLIDEINAIIRHRADLPVVLDPVLQTGTGTGLADDSLIEAIKQKLLPYTTVLTPNLKEACRLSGIGNSDGAAEALLSTGCGNVLVTGADEPTAQVLNSLYSPGLPPRHFHWERLPGVYHGSGCTLASAIAARLASGDTVPDAVAEAQRYCWQSLKYGRQIGKSQLHPIR